MVDVNEGRRLMGAAYRFSSWADWDAWIEWTKANMPTLLDAVEKVEAVRALHVEKHGVYTHTDPGTGEHLGDQPYVICDYDKTTWPCLTQRLLDGSGVPE